MITLQKLKWDNCFSYGEGNELDLSSTTLTQIIGTNGTGKSSIPLIIEEALFNKNSKGIKKADIANRYVNNGYTIYLSFTKDDLLYEVVVNRKSSVKLKLLQEGEDISSHTATNTYRTLQNILGVDFKTFSQLVYQSTNTSLQFLTATDANRKKFLIDLLHLEKYVDLFEIFKNAHRSAVNDRSTLSGKLSTVVKWLENNILEDTNILPMLNLEIDTSKDEKVLRSLMVELQNISEKNKKILQNNQYKKMLHDIPITQYQNSTAQRKEYDHLLKQQSAYEAEVNQNRKLIKKLDVLGQHCPTCEQHISFNVKNDMMNQAAEKANTSEENANELERQIKSIKSENAEFAKAQSGVKTWEDLYRNIDQSLQGDILDKHELESRIQKLQGNIQSSKDSLAGTAAENERRTKRNTRIQIIQEQTEEFQQERLNYEKTLLQQQNIETNLEILKKSFSTNGLIAYKIESLVKELEGLVNQYLGELSDGRFTLQFVVSNDKLNVEITDNGNVVDITALSSGELARVNTATLIAIRKLMSSISKSRINILFLDEVINVLDDTGREKIVEVLLQEENLNTYIVSHGWTHPLLEKIEVVRQGNVSTLEW
tara:strand:+ start:2390 stop:4186 length:1797 start_codon:yes stop_codon:yes gene_type:complete